MGLLRDLMLLWPSKVEIVSSDTPFYSRSTVNVSRSRWEWPSSTPAMSYTFLNLRCQSVIELFGLSPGR